MDSQVFSFQTTCPVKQSFHHNSMSRDVAACPYCKRFNPNLAVPEERIERAERDARARATRVQMETSEIESVDLTDSPETSLLEPGPSSIIPGLGIPQARVSFRPGEGEIERQRSIQTTKSGERTAAKTVKLHITLSVIMWALNNNTNELQYIEMVRLGGESIRLFLVRI